MVRSSWYRVAFLTLMLIGVALELGCGDVFRPVEIPIIQNPGDPKLFHFVMMISDNGDNHPGAATQIDTSGDSNVGVANMGRGPVHATLLLPGASRVFVANQIEETVSIFNSSPPCASIPCPVTGLGTVTTATMPAGSRPSYVHSTESSIMYVLMPGLNPPAVGVLNAFTGVLASRVAVGANPVSMVETPDGKKLYVVNQGDNTVTVIDTTDHTVRATVAVDNSPTHAIATRDNSTVFVLNEGSQTVSVIRTTDDQRINTLPAGAGANSLYLDPKLNRLYVTNGGAGTVSIYDVAGATPKCAVGTSGAACELALGVQNPMGITALADGTKAFVLSVQANDPASTITAQLTAIKSLDNSLGARTAIPDYNNPPANACAGLARGVRFVVASSGDSGRVYVGHCDAGGVYILPTSVNPTMVFIPAPVSAKPVTTGPLPPPQSPVFLLAGR